MEQMLDEVCGYLNNWFLVKPNGIHLGKFEVTDDGLSVDFLQTGQYFRVRNSVFNDGVWKYPAANMIAESFSGEIWAMAIPPAVIALVDEIATWVAKYGTIDSVNMSPFQSESFNNYSYSKSGGGGATGTSSGGSSPTTWRDVFASRLVRWKKI